VADLPGHRQRPRRGPGPLAQRYPSGPDASPPSGGKKDAGALDRVTDTDLLEELEGCDPDAQVRLAHQPAWPLAYAIDPANAAVEVGLDGTSVASLSQGAQLGYLPEPARTQLGW
jgi:hypothetical protein